MSVTVEALSLAQRLGELLGRLGLERAHVAAGSAVDAVTLARAFPERVASMTLVSPARFSVEPLRVLEERVLFISGDRGPGASTVPSLLGELPRARSVRLANFADSAWADTVAERRDEVSTAMRALLDSTVVPDAGLQAG